MAETLNKEQQDVLEKIESVWPFVDADNKSYFLGLMEGITIGRTLSEKKEEENRDPA